MENVEFDDFKIIAAPNTMQIEKYSRALPASIIELWKKYGFGSVLDGYLRIVNPDDYEKVLQGSFELATPDDKVVFTTAMGDLIVLKNSFLYFLNFRYGKFEVIAKDLKFFFKDIFDEGFLEEELEWKPYKAAKKKYGEPAFDECFGYQPILAAGGSEKVDNLKKVRLIEHIEIVTQFAGQL